MPTTAATIKHRTQITGTNNPGIQISKNPWNDSEIMAGGNTGGLCVRDGGQTDGWGLIDAVASGQVLASAGTSTLPTWTSTPSLSTLTLSSNLILDPTSQIKWGATASFPMLRSNGTQVQAVLADASAYAPFQAGEFITNTAGGGTGFAVITTAVKIGTNPAATGALRVANNQFANGRDSTNTVDYALIGVNGSNQVAVGDAAVRHIVNGSDIQWGKALVALGGGAAPTLGTIGGSGPATAAQNTWMRVLDSTGAAFWVPAWK